MAEDQPFLAGRRPAVVAGDDLAVRTADAERDSLDQQLVRARLGIGHVDHGGRTGLQRDDGQCAHGVCLPTAGFPTSIAADPHMRATSSTRLGIALVVQLAITIADVSITGSGVIVSSAALLVPFALAVIGNERETAITAVVAFAIGIGSLFWNDTPSAGQTIYRIVFYALVALLTVVAARARERATDLADNNEALARDLDATQARLDGILGSLGEAVTVHDERGKTIYANEAAAKLLGLRERRGGARQPSPASSPRTSRSRRTTARRWPSTTCPAAACSQGENAPTLLTRSVRHDTGEAFWLLTKATLTEDPPAAGWRSTSSRTSPTPRTRSCASASSPRPASCSPRRSTTRQTLERVAPHDRPAAGRLVRASTCSTTTASWCRSRSPTSTPRRWRWRTTCANATRRTSTRRPACPRSCAAGPAELYREIPEELIEQGAQRRGAPADHPRARDALGDGRADAARRPRRSA